MRYNVVKIFFQDTINNGYKFALGGGEISDSGSFITKSATIDYPLEHFMVVAGEVFGPIVPVIFWTTEDEVISHVNNTSSWLGGAVGSSDANYAYAPAKRIEAGTVWSNSFEKPIPREFFAGHKESGVGGERGKAGRQHVKHPLLQKCCSVFCR
jgi:acyl-CoA reductase-like NAD-dependent aldehyde dehydrogenase